MPQSFVEPGDIAGDQFQLRGAEAHHVIRVLRCQANDTIHLFDGTGQQYKAVLTKVDANEDLVHGKIIEKTKPENSKQHLCLFQGLPKGAKMDFIIEKSVELGVDEILPFLSQKSLIKLTPQQSEKKIERWMRLIKAAAKQCNRHTMPSIANSASLMEVGSQFTKGITFVFSENPKSRPMGDVLRSSKSRLLESARINMIVGPESGLSEKEFDWLVGLGAIPVSIGKYTLRTETAGLVALALVRYELNLL